tara:strand:- start:673 stop:804 length:132 start_codon:yes stop_codon:yes gene_type:complete
MKNKIITNERDLLKKIKPLLIAVAIATFIFLAHLLEAYMPVTH